MTEMLRRLAYHLLTGCDQKAIDAANKSAHQKRINRLRK